MISAQVDTKRYNQLLAALSDALMGSRNAGDRADAQNILRSEAGLLAKEIMHLAPPSQQVGKARSGKAEQRAGQSAIRNDLRKLIGVADTDKIVKFTTAHGRQDIDGWLAMDDGSTIHVKWDYASSSVSDIKQIHKQHRNARGRVSNYRRGARGKWYRTIITTSAIRERYIRMVQKRVGMTKASWGDSARRIAGELVRGIPAWVKQHTPSQHAISNLANADNKLKPGLAFGSNAAGNDRIKRDRIQYAIKYRMNAIVKRTQLVLSGYASDVRRGMKPKRRAKSYGSA